MNTDEKMQTSAAAQKIQALLAQSRELLANAPAKEK